MELRATSMIRECLVLAYVTKWIESEIPTIKQNSLGKASMVILDEAHRMVVLEIAHVKELMRSNGFEVLERESQEKHIWVKYKDPDGVFEATYPKAILLPEVECRLKDLFRVKDHRGAGK